MTATNAPKSKKTPAAPTPSRSSAQTTIIRNPISGRYMYLSDAITFVNPTTPSVGKIAIKKNATAATHMRVRSSDSSNAATMIALTMKPRIIAG